MYQKVVLSSYYITNVHQHLRKLRDCIVQKMKMNMKVLLKGAPLLCATLPVVSASALRRSLDDEGSPSMTDGAVGQAHAMRALHAQKSSALLSQMSDGINSGASMLGLGAPARAGESESGGPKKSISELTDEET